MGQWLPIFLNLRDKPVLLVGAGEIATEKLPKLFESGAKVKVVAKSVIPEMQQYIDERSDSITLAIRPVEARDFDNVFLVLSAIDDSELNTTLRAWAHERNTLFNAADQAAHCDFFMTGTVRRGPLTIAVSSEGTHPGLTRAVRKFLEEVLPTEHLESIKDLTTLRARLRRVLPDPSIRLKALRRLTAGIESEYFGHAKETLQ